VMMCNFRQRDGVEFFNISSVSQVSNFPLIPSFIFQFFDLLHIHPFAYVPFLPLPFRHDLGYLSPECAALCPPVQF
jgi:hypothetical protein